MLFVTKLQGEKNYGVTSVCNIISFYENCNTLVHPYMYHLFITLVHNIPSMRWRNTDIGWNKLMLQCYTPMLCRSSYSLSIHTCLWGCYITMLHCMSVSTFRHPVTQDSITATWAWKAVSFCPSGGATVFYF